MTFDKLQSTLEPAPTGFPAILFFPMAEVTVYTTEPCPYCSRAKGLLKSRKIEFHEINMAREPEARAELAARTGLRTFPQIVIDGTALGGWTELEAADKDGRLAELLA